MNNIDILERVCECRRFSGVFTDVECIFKAIETLIAENKELKEEIEELKEDNKHQWEERCKLTFELENSTSNDKIKAKIEYYEKIDNPVGKRVLQSLLEKEGE